MTQSRDELVLAALDQGLLAVDFDTGLLYRTRGPGGRRLTEPKEVTTRSNKGWLQFDLSVDGLKRTVYAHRVVWVAAHGVIPEQYPPLEVDHIDQDRSHNALSNLRLVDSATNAANRTHDFTGTHNSQSRLDWGQVREIRRRHPLEGTRVLSQEFEVSETQVRNIMAQRAWWPEPDESKFEAPNLESEPEVQVPQPESDPHTHSLARAESEARAELRRAQDYYDPLTSKSRLGSGMLLDDNPELYEEVKAAYLATGGSSARTARLVGVAPSTVSRYSQRDGWPAYLDPHTVKTGAETSAQARLRWQADQLWGRVVEMTDSMVIETKEPGMPDDKRAASAYVESLAQRSGALRVVFDSWMRVMGLLEPETFAPHQAPQGGPSPHMTQINIGRDVDGVDRLLADAVTAAIPAPAGGDTPAALAGALAGGPAELPGQDLEPVPAEVLATSHDSGTADT